MRKEWLNKCNKYCYKLHKKWLEEKMARKSGWESEVDSDEEMSDDEPMCCVGCGKDGKFPENRDGDTMCECCMSDEEDEDYQRHHKIVYLVSLLCSEVLVAWSGALHVVLYYSSQ